MSSSFHSWEERLVRPGPSLTERPISPDEMAVAMVPKVSPSLSIVVNRAPSSTVAICLRNEVSASPRPTAMIVMLSDLQALAWSTALSLLPQIPSVRTTMIPTPGRDRMLWATSSGLASVPLPPILTLRSSMDPRMTRESLVSSCTTLILSPNPMSEK